MRLNRVLLLCALSLAAEAQRFVRFISTDGKEYTGDAILPSNTTDASKSTSARLIQGDILGNFTITKQVMVYNDFSYLHPTIADDMCSKFQNFCHRFLTSELEPFAA